MSFLGDMARLLSVAGLGIFAGANLTEGLVLVPYWRSLRAADFYSWYAANDRRLLDFFRPLTTAAALLSLGAALASFWQGHPGRWAAASASLLTFASVAGFFVYFEKANASFSAGHLPADQLESELARWAAWHWARTCLALAALAAGLSSLAPLP